MSAHQVVLFIGTTYADWLKPRLVNMMLNTHEKEYAINAYSFSAYGELLCFMQHLATPPSGGT
jgi:hypothetical protein